MLFNLIPLSYSYIHTTINLCRCGRNPRSEELPWLSPGKKQKEPGIGPGAPSSQRVVGGLLPLKPKHPRQARINAAIEALSTKQGKAGRLKLASPGPGDVHVT